MLKHKEQWEKELDTSLLKMEKGFIKNQGIEKISERVAKWPALAGLTAEDIKVIEFGDQKPDELFYRDADRTFADETNKKELIQILTYLKHQFGDYQQGLSFVTSFFMLTMDSKENIALMVKINNMLPGFWKHEAIGFGTSAFTFYHILSETNPKITDHLSKNLIDAGTFCQRWFLGLCVHLLPFEYLFDFIEAFLQGGLEYLYQFGLSLFHVLEDRILLANNPNTIFALLRLDEEEITDAKIFRQILDNTSKYDIKKYDLKAIDADVYERHLKKRIESAHKVIAQAVVIDDCQWCNDNLPEFYCVDCKQVFCEDCLNDDSKVPEDHTDAHETISMEEYETNVDKYTAKSEEVESLAVTLQDLTV
ncbi:hypothetical protein CYY_007659 [Polysphondylium violaceum]|uniref:RabGAP/TBC domain-containing protein n=1 Tax=Polysphondylium violaceum TaxID=133409 RepID=A0A8J4PQH2_9MYCE|nr:hypothetical protein CYY_007659 [Polysphondylium violaceum]